MLPMTIFVKPATKHVGGKAALILGRIGIRGNAGRKKEKQRKLPSAAFRLVPSPRYFANLLKRSQNNTLTLGTHHTNWLLPKTSLLEPGSTLQNQKVAAGAYPGSAPGGEN
jgi:hypothetical protein